MCYALTTHKIWLKDLKPVQVLLWVHVLYVKCNTVFSALFSKRKLTNSCSFNSKSFRLFAKNLFSLWNKISLQELLQNIINLGTRVWTKLWSTQACRWNAKLKILLFKFHCLHVISWIVELDISLNRFKCKHRANDITLRSYNASLSCVEATLL